MPSQAHHTPVVPNEQWLVKEGVGAMSTEKKKAARGSTAWNKG
jgi:hypothetical protein